MKNKGFTLVELLGVIVILSLLVILIFPNIINSVKNSSEKTDELTRDLIYSAADLYITNHSNIFPKTNGNKYTILLQNLIDEEYLGSPINLSNNEDITNKKCINVSYEDGFTYELNDISTCESKCHLYNDQGEIGVIDMGDKIQCEFNNEYFYVVSNSNGKVDMLTEYNLGCGGNISTLYEQTEEAIRCVFFSTSNYPIFNHMEDIYTSNLQFNNLYIAYVFEKYKAKLNTAGIYVFDIKPISYNQLIDLGCSEETSYCYGAPEWLTTINGMDIRYWTRTSFYEKEIFVVSQDMIGTQAGDIGNPNPEMEVGNDRGAGFRPVVSIQEKDIKIN